MNRSSCPTDRLARLIEADMSPQESAPLLAHLEECTSCQSRLESLAAHDSWWLRAERGLSSVELDASGRLPASDEQAACAVEALLESGNTDNEDAVVTSQPVLDPPAHPEMLGRIGEFDIEAKIGQGGMGIVFRGYDRSLNRPVAVKVMAPHLSANGVARKRFAREAQAAAAVVHPHVVPIYRVNSSPDRPYIAMALVDGCSLQDHVAEQGPLDVKDAVRISIQIADGLSAAHRQGLIHRDMKPANILIERDVSRVMISDFGLARAVDEVAMTQSSCLAGTPHYMSPEQVAGDAVDHRSDLFSLGCVMYFMATGEEPFRGDNAFAVINKISSQTAPSAREVNPDVPPVLDRLIARLLEKDAADRIPSASALYELLTAYLAHLQDPQHHPEPRLRSTRRERRRWWTRCAMVSAAAMVVFGLAWGAGLGAGRSKGSNSHDAAGVEHERNIGQEHGEHGDAGAHHR